ncbi:MAG: hypothetical protein ABJQ34_16790 [Paracoccaceae bacterium]
MRDKSYDWSEAAENWANEILGEDDSHQIALPNVKISPLIETFTPIGTAPIPDGFTCEDTSFAPSTQKVDDQEPPLRPVKNINADSRVMPTFRTRRTIVKVIPKRDASDTDTFVFSPHEES